MIRNKESEKTCWWKLFQTKKSINKVLHLLTYTISVTGTERYISVGMTLFCNIWRKSIGIKFFWVCINFFISMNQIRYNGYICLGWYCVVFYKQTKKKIKSMNKNTFWILFFDDKSDAKIGRQSDSTYLFVSLLSTNVKYTVR